MKITDLSSLSFLHSNTIKPSADVVDEKIQLRLLVDSIKDCGLIFLDVNGNVESQNLNIVKIQDYCNEDISGYHFSRFYTPSDVQNGIPVKHLELARKYGRIEEEINVVKKDGSYFWAKIILTSLKSESELLVGYSLIIRDQSKSKEREENLRRNEMIAQKAFESNKIYAVFTLDSDGRIKSWNRGAGKILGYERGEVLEKHFSILFPIESSKEKALYELNEARETGGYQEEGWRIHKDGSRFWANVVISPIKNDDLTIIGYTKIISDITDRKRLEDLFKMAYTDLEKKIDQRTNELMNTNIKLQEAIKIRDEFLSIASHELKTPLTPLKLQTQIIRKRVNDGTFKDMGDDKLIKMMNIFESSVDRLTNLMENLLDVSMINLERMVIRKKRINLKTVFEVIFERYQSTLDLNKTEIFLNIEEDIWGDFDQLKIEQVFLNLLMNGLKYGEQKPIEINGFKKEAFVIIEFKDQGTGIEVDHLDKIFERYVQLDIHKNVSGLGLGLYITKEIVESHGGSITVESQQGKGSIFRVKFPIS